MVSWHDAQPLLTPAWIIAAVGAGLRKAVPGPVALLATPGTSAAGVLPRWQLSHLVALGRCDVAPGPLVLGITTILLMP